MRRPRRAGCMESTRNHPMHPLPIRDAERTDYMILNFHDLGEGGENDCYRELLKYWPRRQVVSLTYDLEREDPAAILFDSMAHGPFELIVGTGFGGVLALLAGRATGARTVLVNPMYPIRRYLPSELPDYGYGDALFLHEQYLISDVPAETLGNVFLILGRDDDVTDTARTPAYFRPGNSRFVEGGHHPEGEDFTKAFGELTGGILASREGSVEGDECDPDFTDADRPEGGDLLYEDVRVDDVDASDGHIVVNWSLPGEAPGSRALYLFYADGKWRRDEEDGRSLDEAWASAVLRKASGPIIARTEPVRHDGQHYWGWGW